MWWVKAGLAVAVLGIWGVVALAPDAPSPAINIEVLTPEGWQPLDFSVVGSVTPTVRISGELPEGFRVFNDRLDGRAGIEGGPNGLGRELTELFQPADGGWEASFPVLVGVNTILVTDETGEILASATMLNYSPQFEDLNGNGVLDTGEDVNHNGVLDPGEDVNGNGVLDIDEDFNNNGILDPGEDLNGNGLLDYSEDFIPNGALDTDEDFNDNGVLDPGEDLNGNGELDEEVVLPVTPLLDPEDIAYDDLGVAYHRTSIILHFVPEATDVHISEFLRTHRLLPLGLIVDATVEGSPRTVTAEIPGGILAEMPAYQLERVLNGLSPDDPTFPPSEPPPFPLALAVLNLVVEPAVETGERLPDRLLRGRAPNGNEGYQAATGGFDNDGDNPDELDIFWQHFFMDTFAAHRLVDELVPGTSPRRPWVAIIDTGFGNGVAQDLGDIPVARMPLLMSFPGGNNWANLATQFMRDRLPGGHGTHVALFAGGDGSQRVLGTGKDVSLAMFRVGTGAGVLARISAALTRAAMVPNVRVINLSWEIEDQDVNRDGRIAGGEVAPARAAVLRMRAAFRAGINMAFQTQKIVVVAAGNYRHDAFFSFPGVFCVPRRDGNPINDDGDAWVNENAFPLGPGVGQFEDPPEVPFFMAVSATGVEDVPRGPEGLAGFSCVGPQISVSAPGRELQGVEPTNPLSFVEMSGTSFAAPQVCGLAGELIYLDLNRADIGPYSPQQIVEFILATADDLGTTIPHPQPPNALIQNNDPGNRHDDWFGWGRINVWKAVLSALNGGLAPESHIVHGPDQKPTYFDTLVSVTDEPTAVNEGTRWYGFKIITSVRGATVWIDGRQLVDPGANAPDAVPGGPQGEINAYAGVRSDRVILIGVLNEDPTSGIVPVGNNEGEYIITFSIERRDLVDAQGNWRTLSLRRSGDDANDPPFFSLRLDLARMRAGLVPGVAFDDFVFEILAPDFGDAPDPPYPTTLIKDGARHLNSNLEWLGQPGLPQIQGVSPEFDATDPADPDGQPNLRGGNADLDRFDDGVIFFPLTYIPGQNGIVRFTVRVSDGDSPRYRNPPPGPTLYVNGWIDWNTDGDWDDANEHVVPGARIWKRWSPAANRWEWTSQGGNIVRKVAEGNDWVTFEARFPVPQIGPGDLWARFRLDYGENCGARIPPWKRGGGPAAANPQPTGTVRFGEVEDYFIGADFGDAPDPRYPTLSEHAGARHLDVHCEWLNYGVSREPDACLAPPPPATGDQDNAARGQPPNLGFRPGCSLKDLDLLDDAQVRWFRHPVFGPGIELWFRVTSTISAHGYDIMGVDNDGDGRIDEDPVDQQDNDGDGLVNEDGPNPILLTTMSPNAPVPMVVPVLSTPPWSGGKGRYQSVDADDDRDGRLNEEVINGRDDDGDGLVDEDPPIRKPLIINVFIDWNADGDWDDPGEWVVRDGEIAPETFGKDGQYTLGEPFIDQNGDGVWQPGEPFTDVAGVNDQHYRWFFSAPPGFVPPERPIWVRIRLSYAELSDGTVPMGALPPGAPFGIIPSHDLEKLGIAHAGELGANLLQAAGPRGGMYFGEVEDYPVVRIVKAASVYEAAPETEFDYTITFSNPGRLEFSDVQLFDPIPAELEFVSLTQAPAGVYYDSEQGALVGTFDVPPESETRITYRVRVRTTVSEGVAIRNCPRLTYGGHEVEFCSEEVSVVPTGPAQFYATVTVNAGESVILRPDELSPEFWEYMSRDREVEPVTVVQFCMTGLGCTVNVSGGIEGVTFQLAEPGTEFPDWTATELPPGLQLNEQIGAIYGIPASEGTWYPAVLAIDQATGETLAIWLLTLTVERPEEQRPRAAAYARAPGQPPSKDVWVLSCTTVTFDGRRSRDPDGRIVRYEWDFGDGTQDHGPMVTHHFKAPGTYRVCLTVWDDDGLRDRDCVTVHVSWEGG